MPVTQLEPRTSNETCTQAGTRRVVVIGAGFGGLAAGVRLAEQGHSVRILEAGVQVGGRVVQIQDRGFTLDTGPTLVTLPDLFRDLWNVAGRCFENDVKLVPLDPFYQIRFRDGPVFD